MLALLFSEIYFYAFYYTFSLRISIIESKSSSILVDIFNNINYFKSLKFEL
jgi:hypothetical protein